MVVGLEEFCEEVVTIEGKLDGGVRWYGYWRVKEGFLQLEVIAISESAKDGPCSLQPAPLNK